MALTTVPASLSATALTLTTAAQPNITSVGTLTGLTVSGNIAGTLTTAAQPNITSVGTLSSLLTAAAKIKLTDVGNATVAALQLTDAGLGISSPATDQMNFITADVTRMIIDSGGNVGIAQTPSGNFPLEITKVGGDAININSAADFSGIRMTDNSHSFALRNAANKFFIYDVTNTTQRVTLDDSGNFGIGTGTSTLLGKLHIAETAGGAAGVDFPIVLSSDRYQADYGVGIVFRPENLSTNYAHKTAIMGSGGGYGYNFADILFCFNESTTVGDQVSLSDAKVTFKKNGNVGIGMSPAQLLDLNASSGLSLRFYNSGSFKAGLQVADSSGQMIGTSAANDFAIRSQSNLLFSAGGNTEAMRIDSSGNVGIGATPASGVRLDIRANSTTTLGDFRNANASGYGLYVAGGSSSSQYAFRAADKDNNALFSIMGDGNVGIGVTDPTANLEIYSASTSSHINMLKLTMPSWSNSVNYLKNIVWEDTGNDLAGIGLLYDGGKANMHFHSFYYGGYKSESDKLMSILGNGNVGIGEDAPDYRLHVEGANVLSGGGLANLCLVDTTVYNGTNPGAGITLRGKYNSGHAVTNFATIQGIKENATDGNYASVLRFMTRAHNANLTERMRICSDGRVEIRNAGTDKIVRFMNTGGGTQGVTIGTTTSNSVGTGLHVGHDTTKAFLHPYNYGAGAYQQMEIACSDFVLKVNGSASGMTMNSSAVATFYGDVKINDANDRLLQNGVAREAKGGYINGNQSVSFTVNHTSQSVMHVRCGFNHYGFIGSYGAAFDQYVANGPGGMSTTTATVNVSSGAGGSWSISRVDSSNITITKNAGTYAGGGYYFIIVEGANL